MTTKTLTVWQKVDIPFGFVQAGESLQEFGEAIRTHQGCDSLRNLSQGSYCTVSRLEWPKVAETILIVGRNSSSSQEAVGSTIAVRENDNTSRNSTDNNRSIAGTTESNYLTWAKQQQLPARSVELAAIGTKGFWVGEPDSENVILYFHGGGWAMPGGDGHCQFLSSFVSQAKRSGKSVSVLFLYYDLAPGGQYPRQLTQAIELLRYSTTTLGKSPANIFLLGDSAGANMVLGVLSHLMHPHPEIPPLEIGLPLKGAMISSPVTVLDTKNSRFRTQEVHDPASASTINTWINNMLGSRAPDGWSQPLTNDSSWWYTLDKVVKDMLITVASVEMMAEDTLACTAKVKSVYNGLTIFSSDVDFHAQCTIGPSLGMELGEAAELMVSWAIARC